MEGSLPEIATATGIAPASATAAADAPAPPRTRFSLLQSPRPGVSRETNVRIQMVPAPP
jgi:hypothetical protein